VAADPDEQAARAARVTDAIRAAGNRKLRMTK